MSYLISLGFYKKLIFENIPGCERLDGLFFSFLSLKGSIRGSTNPLVSQCVRLQSIRCMRIAQHSRRTPSLHYSTTELSSGHPSTAKSVPTYPYEQAYLALTFFFPILSFFIFYPFLSNI